jgi:hypothetical protein
VPAQIGAQREEHNARLQFSTDWSIIAAFNGDAIKSPGDNEFDKGRKTNSYRTAAR